MNTIKFSGRIIIKVEGCLNPEQHEEGKVDELIMGSRHQLETYLQQNYRDGVMNNSFPGDLKDSDIEFQLASREFVPWEER